MGAGAGIGRCNFTVIMCILPAFCVVVIRLLYRHDASEVPVCFEFKRQSNPDSQSI